MHMELKFNHLKKNPIYCIGGATIDCKLKPIHTLEFATSNPAHSVMTYGGVARNVAHTLANLTQQVHLQCVIGKDSEGQNMLSYMQEKGIHTNHSLQIPDQTTAHYYAILSETGELHLALAVMEIYEHIPFDLFTQCWENWLEGSLVFVDTNLPSQIIKQALHLCKVKKMRLCIDPVSTAKAKKLPDSLEGIYLIKPDQYELTALTRIEITSQRDAIKAGQILLDRGVQNIVISLGKVGYIIMNEFQHQHYPALNANPVKDVSGAGDAFIAGILFGLQQELILSTACQLGAAAAALTVQTYQTVFDKLSLSDLTNKIEEKQNADIF